jgi:hypothetical protein
MSMPHATRGTEHIATRLQASFAASIQDLLLDRLVNPAFSRPLVCFAPLLFLGSGPRSPDSIMASLLTGWHVRWDTHPLGDFFCNALSGPCFFLTVSGMIIMPWAT